MPRRVPSLITSTLKCPETGSKVGRFGFITSLVSLPGTCWYIAKFGETIRILEFCEIRGKNKKTKREYILNLEKKPKSEREYEHIDLYEAGAFNLDVEERMQTLQFHNPIEIWDNLYVEETQDAIYYIIVG